ncbi:MAG: radical SAM protein [Candidatus Omnitrophota bacterium]
MERVSFSWNLVFKCNYRCPYCWFDGKWQEMGKMDRCLPVDELVRYWANIQRRYGMVGIEILGGEPFLYPNFVPLMRELSNMHSINITTNLSCSIDEFIKDIDPSRVRLRPTFHPFFADYDSFVKKASVLREHNFGNTVVYLAYPPQLKLLNHYHNRFANQWLSLSVLTFWGKYNGLDYPLSYTDEEREILSPYLGERAGEKFQTSPKEVKGKLCRAGQTYAMIHSDGTAFRCGGANFSDRDLVIGNLFDENFKLIDAPLPCSSEHCPCNEWAFLLVDENAAKVKDAQDIKEIVEQEEIKPEKAVITNDNRQPEINDILQDKVSLTWDIHRKCNYHCPHCWFEGRWEEEEKDNLYLPANRWISIWNNMYQRYGKVNIVICGGEPLLYPGFVDILEGVSQRHCVEVITNGSCITDEFAERINPVNVSISLSFYPYIVDYSEVADKVQILKKNKIPVGITYIAYPRQFDFAKVKFYRKEFKVLGCRYFNLTSYWGKYNGAVYPDAYTAEEKKFMMEYSDNPQNFILSAKIESSKGRLCWAGGRYALINTRGEILRCGSSGVVIGKIQDDGFRLLGAPESCPVEFCKCSEYKAVD